MVRHRAGAGSSGKVWREVGKVLDLSKRGFHGSRRSVFCPSSVCPILPFLAEPVSSLLFPTFLNLKEDNPVYNTGLPMPQTLPQPRPGVGFGSVSRPVCPSPRPQVHKCLLPCLSVPPLPVLGSLPPSCSSLLHVPPSHFPSPTSPVASPHRDVG